MSIIDSRENSRAIPRDGTTTDEYFLWTRSNGKLCDSRVREHKQNWEHRLEQPDPDYETNWADETVK